ncbi:MAG: T9SS type A sorting domain-containing protein [Chitinophagales bacterium]|nr:T9SS type A sorting domain-containing protein [Chitinophagales bacterium]
MKSRFTCLILALGFCLLSTLSYAQSPGDYQSFQSGFWGDVNAWSRYDGSTWVNPAPSIPTQADGIITILNGHTITIGAPRTADQIVVNTGGTLSVNTGGSNNLTLNNGSGDDLIVDGTLNISGNALVGLGTTVLINGMMNVGTNAVTIQPSVTVSPSGTANFTGNSTKTISANFNNEGIFNWGTGDPLGGISLGSGVTFTNDGVLNEQYQSNRGFFPVAGCAIINNGTINKTTIYSMTSNNTFTNNGTINVAIGTFNANGTFTNSSTGIFSGSGTIAASGTFVNDGQVSPGNSPGILTANPATIQATTANVVLEILDGSGAGTGHDQLALTGNTNLDGVTLTVTEIAPGNTAPLQTYTVMTTTGTFSGTPTIVKTDNYTVTVNANTIVAEKIALFPLPVVWGNFTALARNNNSVQLNWSTLQETNISHFVVEYSSDGSNYTAIGNVSARGTTTDISNYSFFHNTPDIQKTNLYRIRQIDFDGKSSISEIRPVKFNKGLVVPVLATPNPVHDRLQLSIQAEGIRIMLVDMSGRTIERSAFQPGSHEINMSSLAPGVYQLVIFQDGKKMETQKIVKQ